MELHLILDQIEPAMLVLPAACPTPRCGSTQFRLHQQVSKSVGDMVYHHVTVHRYKCVRCGHTFRVYPHGVTHAYTSQGVQHLAVLLHRLGLSFGEVSTALDALGMYMCKSRVYDAVQAAKRLAPHWTRLALFEAVHRPTYKNTLLVKCMQHWLPLALIADTRSRLVLAVDPFAAEEVAALHEQIGPVIAALGGALELVDEHRRTMLTRP